MRTRSRRHRIRQKINQFYRGIAALGSPLWRSTPSVFVLSTGRTGTETLMHLLALCPDVNSFHEPHPQLLEERKAARVEIGRNPEKYTRIFARARGSRLLAARLQGRVYVETSARLTFFSPVIADLLPNSKFIYIHRHPAEVVRSGMRRRWYVDHPADYARITPDPSEVPPSVWTKWEPFRKICWYWNAYNRFALDFVRTVDSSRVLSLNAREVFDGSAAQRIYDLAGVSAPGKSAIERVLSAKHNAQKLADFPKYADWTPEMRGTLSEIAGMTMTELGYRDEYIERVHG